MNVSIIGDGLTSLLLAKSLTDMKIKVTLYVSRRVKKKVNTRTIGIANDNFKLINNEIVEIDKITWKINQIEILSDKLKNEKILNFKKKNESLFHIIKNNLFYNVLNGILKKNKFFKKKKILNHDNFKRLIKNHNDRLIINCDRNNYISKNFFYRKDKKEYNNHAYTTLIKHKSIDNRTAIQIFTNKGPIAFLPISKKETSIVYSIKTSKKLFTNKEIIDLINKYNPKYSIENFSFINSFEIKSLNLRKYFYKNILAFGDLLHTVHPLAGQGFNMSIRDVIEITKIFKSRINLGLQLDNSIFKEFEKKKRHKNFLFLSGIDLIYEFFNFEKKLKSAKLIELLRAIGNNKKVNNFFINFANKGI